MQVEVKWSKPEAHMGGGDESWPKMKGNNGGRGVLRTIGNVEQVRRTIGEHGFLEPGQRIMGYGTRHKGHIHSKQRGCGLGSGEAENGSPRWVTWPEKLWHIFARKKNQLHAHTLTLNRVR